MSYMKEFNLAFRKVFRNFALFRTSYNTSILGKPSQKKRFIISLINSSDENIYELRPNKRGQVIVKI